MFVDVCFFILLLFSLFSLCIVVWNTNLIFQSVYIVNLIISLFAFPQIFAIYSRNLLPEIDTGRLFVVIILSWVLINFGWWLAKNKCFNINYLKSQNPKLIKFGVLYTAIGYLLYNFIQGIDVSEMGGQATGIFTIYVFFFQVFYIGVSICYFFYLRTKRKWLLLITILGFLLGFYVGVIGARRTLLFLIVLIFILPLYLDKKLVISRTFIILGILFSFVSLFAIGVYRSYIVNSDSKFNSIVTLFKEVDIKESFNQFLFEDGISYELVNAGYVIKKASEENIYKYGVDYYNEIIWRYLPGQLIGVELKKSLIFDRLDLTKYNQNYTTGTTATGFGDSFLQFGYFGCLFFLFLGFGLRLIWNFLVRYNSPLNHIFYCYLTVESIVCITHGTTKFIPAVIYIFIFTYLSYYVSKFKI